MVAPTVFGDCRIFLRSHFVKSNLINVTDRRGRRSLQVCAKRFIRSHPFRQTKPTDKSKFKANKLRFIELTSRLRSEQQSVFCVANSRDVTANRFVDRVALQLAKSKFEISISFSRCSCEKRAPRREICRSVGGSTDVACTLD